MNLHWFISWTSLGVWFVFLSLSFKIHSGRHLYQSKRKSSKEKKLRKVYMEKDAIFLQFSSATRSQEKLSVFYSFIFSSSFCLLFSLFLFLVTPNCGLGWEIFRNLKTESLQIKVHIAWKEKERETRMKESEKKGSWTTRENNWLFWICFCVPFFLYFICQLIND